MKPIEIIESIRLPILSSTLLKIIKLEKSDSISLNSEMKEIIELDPCLAANILSISNSPIYGFSQKVQTISHAMNLLGIRKIRNIAFRFSIYDFLKNVRFSKKHQDVINLILKKPLLLSATSQIVANKLNHLNPEEICLSGLLSDIGQLIFFIYSPETYSEIYSIKDSQLISNEKELFGFNHVDMGIEFSLQYNLPSFIKEAITLHSQFHREGEQGYIISISNKITELILSPNQEEKEDSFKGLEEPMKSGKILPTSELINIIKSTPNFISTFSSDFPDAIKDIEAAINSSSVFIESYLNKKMDKEIKKKEFLINELILADKDLELIRNHLVELQKSKVTEEILPITLHKLKNSLTPILGYSQLLLPKITDSSTFDKIKKIEANAMALEYRLNNFSDYFRKPKKPALLPENLNSIISNLNPNFKALLKNTSIKIKQNLDSRIPNDLLNRGQIELLITNILDNSTTAIKLKKEVDGVITISTEYREDSYRLCIMDNGIGMSEEIIQNIWELFFSAFPKKTGIGLSICETIANNHDATIEAHSSEGEYSEFQITFKPKPVKEKHPQEIKILRGNILLVCNDDYLMELYKEILNLVGKFNITTTSGKAALNLINKNLNLVVLDSSIPDLNETETHKLLQDMNLFNKTIIMIERPYLKKDSLLLNNKKIIHMEKPFELMKFKRMVLDKLF
jgi:signal transduction histidine kinase/HD-like signal output (HDOD) protein